MSNVVDADIKLQTARGNTDESGNEAQGLWSLLNACEDDKTDPYERERI